MGSIRAVLWLPLPSGGLANRLAGQLADLPLEQRTVEAEHIPRIGSEALQWCEADAGARADVVWWVDDGPGRAFELNIVQCSARRLLVRSFVPAGKRPADYSANLEAVALSLRGVLRALAEGYADEVFAPAPVLAPTPALAPPPPAPEPEPAPAPVPPPVVARPKPFRPYTTQFEVGLGGVLSVDGQTAWGWQGGALELGVAPWPRLAFTVEGLWAAPEIVRFGDVQVRLKHRLVLGGPTVALFRSERRVLSLRVTAGVWRTLRRTQTVGDGLERTPSADHLRLVFGLYGVYRERLFRLGSTAWHLQLQVGALVPAQRLELRSQKGDSNEVLQQAEWALSPTVRFTLLMTF